MTDSTIIATSLFVIARDFRSFDSVNWVALAYTLSYLGCAVTFAQFSDVIGRRNAFVAAHLLFLVFSMACGFSKSLFMLIAFRALQGIGGSGLYALSMVVLPELCPRELQQHIGSLIGLVIAGSGVLGPILGGILTEYASWRWVFWINGPVGTVSLIILLAAWPQTHRLSLREGASWKNFDYAGSFLIITASVLVVFAFQNMGETENPSWASAVFIGPLVGGGTGWLALIVWEVFATRRMHRGFSPAFPVDLFRNRTYAAAAVSTMFLGYPYLLLMYTFPLKAHIVSGKSALLSSMTLLPMLGASAVGSVISGKVNTARNAQCETILAGACFMTLGCGLLTGVAGAKDDEKALGFLTFAGFGFGLSTAAATILVAVEAPQRDHAAAQGILAQLRVLGGSLGISTSTVLVRGEAAKPYAPTLSQGSQDAERLKDGWNETLLRLETVHEAYDEAFRKGMVCAAAISGAAILVALAGYRKRATGSQSQRDAMVEDEGSVVIPGNPTDQTRAGAV
ncbi:hypothetical protein JDV02_006479 [Purpureocillium takamizusanense]|nr:uncharacterized protein JDV02_006479 [Purpureocillium takamizusanense]UNI20386.1 hypothetical protein JDV02_006479 [Purpureocillium takamizusanense]